MDIRIFVAAIFLGLFALICHAYEIKEATFDCYVTHCTDQGDDCRLADAAEKACTQRLKDKRKAAVEAQRKQSLLKHQAEVNAASKINQANETLKNVGSNPSH